MKLPIPSPLSPHRGETTCQAKTSLLPASCKLRGTALCCKSTSAAEHGPILRQKAEPQTGSQETHLGSRCILPRDRQGWHLQSCSASPFTQACFGQHNSQSKSLSAQQGFHSLALKKVEIFSPLKGSPLISAWQRIRRQYFSSLKQQNMQGL